MSESVDGCRACARQAFFAPSDSVKTVIGCRACARQTFSHHRIQLRPKIDGEQVPNKLFSHHRIWPRPKMDGEYVPSNFFAPSNFTTSRKWAESLLAQTSGSLANPSESPKQQNTPTPSSKKHPRPPQVAPGGIKYKVYRIICSDLSCG